MMYLYTAAELKMVRMQIYLDKALKMELSRLSHRRGVTVSELIRQAIEQILEKSPSGFEEAVEKSFGLWSKRKDLRNTPAYPARSAGSGKNGRKGLRDERLPGDLGRFWLP